MGFPHRGIIITPTTGVDSSGEVSAEGLIEMLKRRTRANMVGGPFKNAKCVGAVALEHTAYCMRALAQDRNVFWLVWVVNLPSTIQSQELSIVILEQGQVGFLEVAQQRLYTRNR